MLCRCKFPFQFPEYHWPHCPDNPANLNAADKKVIAAKFTKSELATISAQGAMRDQPVRKKRSKSDKKAKRGA